MRSGHSPRRGGQGDRTLGSDLGDIAPDFTAETTEGPILRVIDSLQLTARHQVATPANWRPGDDVIIPVAVTDEQARERFPEGWTTLKPYLRVVRQPGASARSR